MSSTDFEILPIQLWQGSISDPFALLQGYYHYPDTASSLHQLQQLFTAAYSDTYEPPETATGNTCFFMERLESLVYAASLLHGNAGPCKAPLTQRGPIIAQSVQEGPLAAMHWLSPAAQENPLLQVTAFFRHSNWPGWRLKLHQWLHAALGNYSICESESPATLQEDCNQLCRLLAAMDLLYRRYTNPAKAALPPTAGKLLHHLLPLLQPQQVFALQQGGGYTGLLFVLPDSVAVAYKNLEELVSMAGIQQPDVHISLHKASTIQYRLQNGHPFYSRACTLGNLVYDTGAAELPFTDPGKLKAIDAEVRRAFYADYPKAQGFLQGARAALQAKDCTQALFMLHQCAELSLRAALMAITGQEVKTHSLFGLLNYARRFAPALLQAFPATDAVAQTQLQLLNRAYNDARYNAAFTVGLVDVRAMLKRVMQLQQLVEKMFN